VLNSLPKVSFSLLAVFAVLLIVSYGGVASILNKRARATSGHDNGLGQDQENVTALREALRTQSKNLDLYLRELKAKYPSQTSLFWANIEASCRHSLIKQRDPSIVLIVNDRDTQDLASTLTNDIMRMLLKVMGHASETADVQRLTLDVRADSDLADMMRGGSHDKLKLHIDTRLVDLFRSGHRVALVNNIEQLPARAMLLFYTYGDDLQTAKFPGVLILMNLNIEGSLDAALRARFVKNNKVLTKYTEDYLFRLLSASIDDDQLKPLFTRIANNVILVNHEPRRV
jgi:hypothetical protein